MKKDDRERCSWATTELYKEYHDEEWGKPVHDDRKLFEMLVLEGMQAGLSWLTILNKRAAFKEAFNEFDYQKIALYDETKIDELMQNPNIVRNRLKIKSTITNAQQLSKSKKNTEVLISLFGLMLRIDRFIIISNRKRTFLQQRHFQIESVKT